MIPILTCVTLLQLEQNTGQTLTQHHVVTVVTGPRVGEFSAPQNDRLAARGSAVVLCRDVSTT